ncbi:transposase [Paenibacillus lactis]|uniref:transposase n=1 Tax=Paenibacillus lactis TaxID=228574 RepID=UPI001642B1AB
MFQPRRTFTPEFKSQMISLYENGMSRLSIVRDYGLDASTLDRWIMQNQKTCFLTDNAIRSPDQNELIELRKEVKRLKVENDVLMKAALIFGRK